MHHACTAACICTRHCAYQHDLVTLPLLLQLSTSRVITMEWIDGCKVNDTAQLTAKSLRPREVALLLLHTFAEMTFVHGCCHADPHPGNIIVRPSPHPAGAALLTFISFMVPADTCL